MNNSDKYQNRRRDELTALYAQIHRMGQLGGGIPPAACHHLIALDGALGNRAELQMSGMPFQSNVANLYEQAVSVQSRTSGFSVDYFPAIGTPNAHVNAEQLARDALARIDAGARRYGDKKGLAHTETLSVTIIALSRSCTSAMTLARLLNCRGSTEPGHAATKLPGIPVRGLVLIDPLTTVMERNERLPDNVEGPVLMLHAYPNCGMPYAAHAFESDPRVITINIPIRHPDAAGGLSLNGPAAVVLEGTTGFLQGSGIPIDDVSVSRRFIASSVSCNALVRTARVRV